VAAGSGYQRLPSWVLGFHGCDEKVGLEVLRDPKAHLKSSKNEYDWLGPGTYFWENDPERARQFAEQGVDGKVTKGSIRKPFVIGAVIDLGLCCNLFDQAGLQELKRAHGELKKLLDEFGLPMPSNGKTQLARKLDKEVIDFMHGLREKLQVPPYQTMRAGFVEGDELYEGTTFCEKSHIQLAVRDPTCIRGYFLPRGLN
jgi:hypothetical protein